MTSQLIVTMEGVPIKGSGFTTEVSPSQPFDFQLLSAKDDLATVAGVASRFDRH